MPKTLQMVCAVALAIIFTTGATLAQTAPMAGTPMPMASGMHPPATPKPCATKQNGCKKKNKKKQKQQQKQMQNAGGSPMPMAPMTPHPGQSPPP
jgi:hypothetical protein